MADAATFRHARCGRRKQRRGRMRRSSLSHLTGLSSVVRLTVLSSELCELRAVLVHHFGGRLTGTMRDISVTGGGMRRCWVDVGLHVTLRSRTNNTRNSRPHRFLLHASHLQAVVELSGSTFACVSQHCDDQFFREAAAQTSMFDALGFVLLPHRKGMPPAIAAANFCDPNHLASATVAYRVGED
jgi:hypothetical protein